MSGSSRIIMSIPRKGDNHESGHIISQVS